MSCMKNFIVIALSLLTCFTLKAKEDPKYPVSAIPEEMKTGMYAVIREQEMRVEIQSQRSLTTSFHTVITILNSNAKNYGSLTVGYDKFRVVKNLRGTVYDAMGSVLKKIKQNEIIDQSTYDGFTLFSDNRIKHLDLSQGVYPYTVEFDYEIEHKALFDLPDFYLYLDDEISIQKTKHVMAYPLHLKPRFKLNNLVEPKKTIADNKETIEWSFNNVKPGKFEKLSPDFRFIVPNAIIAPSDFEFDHYTGNMDTWDNFGQWITSLNKGRDILPELTKQRIKKLVAPAQTDEEKVKILYEFLQSKTRYVGIQLGIGGYQPFDASTVDETGYGDCKALSNYMVAMLKEIGIQANYALINAGEGEANIIPSFPSSQFNHAIVCVPSRKDTIWLECTNQIAPFGYQGSHTGDRKALIITNDGAKVVNTIRYTADQNLQARKGDVYVESTGDAKAKIKTRYQGLQYENHDLNYILGNQYDDQRKWIQDYTHIPSFDITAFSMTNKKDKLPVAIVQLDLSMRKFATVSGKRIFITPNLMNRSTFIPEKIESRKNNIVLRKTFTHMDTIQYHLPEGIYPEFLPEPVKVTSRFGEYESSCKMEQGLLIYVRRMRVNKGEFPPETYKELTDFYKSVNRADNLKLVFMSKT